MLMSIRENSVTTEQVFDSIASLRAVADGATVARVFVTGYYGPGDGGGGHYWWNSSDARSDNGGTVIQSNTWIGNGRWNLLFSDSLNVLQFGAVPDGSTDCTTAFNNAIATGVRVIVPHNGSSPGYVVSNVTVVNEMCLEGELRGVQGPALIVGTSGAAAFLWTSAVANASYIRIRNFFCQAGSNVTGAAFYRQSSHAIYTAYGIFENIKTDRSLLWGYDIFPIFGQWNNCQDGFTGATGAQGHGFITALPQADSQGARANLNTLRNCQCQTAVAGNTSIAAAIDIGSGEDWLFQNCDWELLSIQAIRCQNILGIRFECCWMEQISAAQFGTFTTNAAGGTRPVVFESCKLDAGSITSQLVSIANTCSAVFDNCWFARVPAGVTLADAQNRAFVKNSPAGGSGASTFLVGVNTLTYDVVAGAYVMSQQLHIENATSMPAGGAAGRGLLVSATSNFGIFFGSGAPTLSAAKGSLYLRSDGSSTSNRAYVNTNGATTWTAVTTAA